MRGVNKVILIGNATRAAELRSTTTGKSVASLRIAANRTVHDQEETQFHTVVCSDVQFFSRRPSVSAASADPSDATPE